MLRRDCSVPRSTRRLTEGFGALGTLRSRVLGRTNSPKAWAWRLARRATGRTWPSSGSSTPLSPCLLSSILGRFPGRVCRGSIRRLGRRKGSYGHACRVRVCAAAQGGRLRRRVGMRRGPSADGQRREERKKKGQETGGACEMRPWVWSCYVLRTSGRARRVLASGGAARSLGEGGRTDVEYLLRPRRAKTSALRLGGAELC